MRDKIYRFMQGRNGVDELARMESVLTLVLLLIGLFTRFWPVTLLGAALMVHMYFRVFSKNAAKRYEENQKYVNFRYRNTVAWDKKKRRFKQMKTHRFFKCPVCKQEVRVPKGHGKIEITCPKCREKFIKRT